jgi:hypothetical protein
MKRVVLVLALAAIIATGTAFADHPEGFGIGLVGQYSSWGFGGQGGGLSLKIPGVPIYWGINAVIGGNSIGAGITGDVYVIDQNLNGPFNWFFGVGGYFTFSSWSYAASYSYAAYSATYMDGGVRAPVGISFQPTELLEIFIDIAPSIGVNIFSGYTRKTNYPLYNDDDTVSGSVGLGWGAPVEIGIRLWF